MPTVNTHYVISYSEDGVTNWHRITEEGWDLAFDLEYKAEEWIKDTIAKSKEFGYNKYTYKIIEVEVTTIRRDLGKRFS